VSALEGICKVDPLGVRMGEEVYEEPLKEEMERVEGIRRGVDKVKFSVCILSALWWWSLCEESSIPKYRRAHTTRKQIKRYYRSITHNTLCEGV